MAVTVAFDHKDLVVAIEVAARGAYYSAYVKIIWNSADRLTLATREGDSVLMASIPATPVPDTDNDGPIEVVVHWNKFLGMLGKLGGKLPTRISLSKDTLFLRATPLKKTSCKTLDPRSEKVTKANLDLREWCQDWPAQSHEAVFAVSVATSALKHSPPIVAATHQSTVFQPAARQYPGQADLFSDR